MFTKRGKLGSSQQYGTLAAKDHTHPPNLSRNAQQLKAQNNMK
jgi:hypothetical protein